MGDLRALLELRQAWPLSFAPDGEWLLAASDLPGTRQLYRLPVAGGELEQLTSFAEPVDGFLLPDGRILLSMDEGGNERGQLHLLAAEPQAEPEPLVVDPRFIHRFPAVSRDGALLAYSTNRRNGVDFDVVVRRLETGEERAFELGGWFAVASVSPDGRWVAAHRYGDTAGDGDLFLLGVEDGEVVHATPHEPPADFGTPQWLPGGDAFLAPTSAGRDTLAIGRYELATRAWTVVHESDWDLDCVLDDAGRTLLVHANEDGWSRLELRDPETLELREEVALPGRGVVEHALFSEDGSRLAFAFSTPTEPHQVYV